MQSGLSSLSCGCWPETHRDHDLGDDGAHSRLERTPSHPRGGYHRRRAGNQSPFPPLRGWFSRTGLPSHGPLQPHGAAGARTGRPAGLVRGARCTVGVLAALLHARKRRGTTRSRRVRQEHRRAQTPERRRLRTRVAPSARPRLQPGRGVSAGTAGETRRPITANGCARITASSLRICAR